MLLSLLITPLIGIFAILINMAYNLTDKNAKIIKIIALATSIVNLIISLIAYISFNFSNNQFQLVQECYNISYHHIYLGVDGLSIYFVLLTTIIIPVSLLSN